MNAKCAAESKSVIIIHLSSFLMSDPLAALRPLHAPPPIPWWPPAPGWWLLLLFLVVSALLLLWWWKSRALQRVALRELKAMEPLGENPIQQAAAINRLLKRYALVCWPGADVASLTGEAWLEFLDAHGGNGDFTRGPGRALLTLPYAVKGNSPLLIPHSSFIIQMVRRWLKANRPGRRRK